MEVIKKWLIMISSSMPLRNFLPCKQAKKVGRNFILTIAWLKEELPWISLFQQAGFKCCI